jgi:hypothetical protein
VNNKFALRPFQSRPQPATGAGDRPAESGKEDARSYFSSLGAKLPMAMTISAEFTQLTIPAATAVPAGQWLWHNLIDFDPFAGKLNQDILVFGIWCDLVSPNVSPVTPATDAAWGDERGLGAAIVVGDRSIPGSGDGTNTWCNGVAEIAGIDASVTASYNALSRYFVRTFPTGKYTTGTNKRGLNGAFVPFVRRITQGNRLRASFVLNRAQANAAANKILYGYVSLEIYFGLTRNTVDLSD